MPPTILIADDEPVVRNVLRQQVERAGYRVETATDGADALARATSAGVDLVVTDLVMPNVDGLELVRRCRESRPGLPVIVVTGRATMETAIEALRAGACDYLLKPWEQRRLIERIADLLLEAAPSAAGLLPLCSVCKRIHPPGEPAHEGWIPVEEHLRRELGVEASHGYCPDCVGEARAELRRERRRTGGSRRALA